jgi:hypothetical protein
MTIRIAAWAFVGLIVSGLWGLYFTYADKSSPIGPVASVLARVTQPIAATVVSFTDRPIGLTWVAVANAATYAVAGLVVAKIARK